MTSVERLKSLVSNQDSWTGILDDERYSIEQDMVESRMIQLLSDIQSNEVGDDSPINISLNEAETAGHIAAEAFALSRGWKP